MKRRVYLVVNALTALLMAVAPLFLFSTLVSAGTLTSRSVAVSTSVPGAVNSHKFDFTITSVNVLGSIEFEYCGNDPLVGLPCTPPVGFSASSAVLSAQTGEVGFMIDPVSTANRIVLSRVPSLSSVISTSYTFTNITNPSNISSSYVRVATFSSADGTGARTDSGGLVYSINRQLTTEAFVPPYLTFCVGVTVSGDCSSASGQFLGFGELLSVQPRFLTSQFAGATNDFAGYSVTISGVTMTSGTNVIQALNTPTSSQVGVNQFGMNLRSNSTPAVGSDPSGIGSAIIAPDFAQSNLFTFKNQVVAFSPFSTDFNLFTASYVVNVSSNQAPGVYNTTLTYIATAAF